MDAVQVDQIISDHDTQDMLNDIYGINDSLRRRASNNRDNVTQALRAGRHAVSLKQKVKANNWGKWEIWVVDHTEYESARQAQNDMQLWNAWKGHIDQLVEVGAIHDLDQPEGEFVRSLDDAHVVSISKSAMEEFKRDGVPDSALNFAIEALSRGSVSIHDAQAIVQTAKAIEALEDEEQRDLAESMYRDHGVSNPQVIDMIPQMLEMPDLIEEIETTGHIYVPGLDDGAGRQIPIAQAGRSDIEIALGRHNIESELSAQKTSRHISDRNSGFDYNSEVEGTLQQIMFELQKKAQEDTIYRVVVYSRKAK